MLVKLPGAAILWPDRVAKPVCAGSQAVIKNTKTYSGKHVCRVLPVLVLCSQSASSLACCCLSFRVLGDTDMFL